MNIINENQIKELLERKFKLYKYSLNISERCDVLPEHIHIEPTNACNLRCVHCHQSTAGKYFTKKRGMMEFGLYQKVIDECSRFAVRITLDCQGEPLLHPEITKMVKYAKRKGLSVSLLTNATKLKGEIAKKLVEMQLDRIVFSFEGSNKEVYEKVRRGSHYERTLKNILTFMKINYESGMPTFVCMSMVKSSYTENDVETYKKYFNQFPINTIFISPLLTISGGSLISHEIDMGSYLNMEEEIIPICKLPWESIVVNWDGTVSACPLDYNEAHIVGNANDEMLQDIFNGEKMRKFRRCHIKKNFASIEEQGALCEMCNARFDKEYDIRKMEEYIVNHLVRQLFVLMKEKSEKEIGEDKYYNLIEEINKLNSNGFASDE